MKNAQYHSRQTGTILKASSIKEDILNYLTNLRVEIPANILKKDV